MKTTIDFLEAVKSKRGGISDYALAKVLGVSQQLISKYRTRMIFLGDPVALRVAELLEIDAGYVMACVHQERAKTESERAAWSSIVERLGGLAASVVVGVALFGSPAPAQASPSVTGDNLYYVKSDAGQ